MALGKICRNHFSDCTGGHWVISSIHYDEDLVLTEGQWAEKGCLTLTQVVGRNELQVRYFNWENGVERENGDDKYMLGRFTELLLTHFTYFIDRVIIE